MAECVFSHMNENNSAQWTVRICFCFFWKDAFTEKVGFVDPKASTGVYVFQVTDKKAVGNDYI